MEGYLGETLLAEGHVDEALPHLQRGVSGNVEKPGVHNALGRALRAKGRAQEALDQFLIDIKLDPASAVSQYNAGALLLENERAALSVPYLQEALRLRPEQPEFHYKLGNALMQTGRPAEATSQYETALRLRPNFLEAEVNLAWILASSPEASLRDGAKAVRLAAHSDQLAGGKNPKVLGTLAAAYAEAGQFGQAIATVQRALQADGADPRSPVSGMLRQALALYQSGAPLRDPQLQPEAGVPTVKSN
jgi:spermidine synthase